MDASHAEQLVDNVEQQTASTSDEVTSALHSDAYSVPPAPSVVRTESEETGAETQANPKVDSVASPDGNSKSPAADAGEEKSEPPVKQSEAAAPLDNSRESGASSTSQPIYNNPSVSEPAANPPQAGSASPHLPSIQIADPQAGPVVERSSLPPFSLDNLKVQRADVIVSGDEACDPKDETARPAVSVVEPVKQSSGATDDAPVNSPVHPLESKDGMELPSAVRVDSGVPVGGEIPPVSVLPVSSIPVSHPIIEIDPKNNGIINEARLPVVQSPVIDLLKSVTVSEKRNPVAAAEVSPLSPSSLNDGSLPMPAGDPAPAHPLKAAEALLNPSLPVKVSPSNDCATGGESCDLKDAPPFQVGGDVKIEPKPHAVEPQEQVLSRLLGLTPKADNTAVDPVKTVSPLTPVDNPTQSLPVGLRSADPVIHPSGVPQDGDRGLPVASVPVGTVHRPDVKSLSGAPVEGGREPLTPPAVAAGLFTGSIPVKVTDNNVTSGEICDLKDAPPAHTPETTKIPGRVPASDVPTPSPVVTEPIGNVLPLVREVSGPDKGGLGAVVGPELRPTPSVTGAVVPVVDMLGGATRTPGSDVPAPVGQTTSAMNAIFNTLPVKSSPDIVSSHDNTLCDIDPSGNPKAPGAGSVPADVPSPYTPKHHTDTGRDSQSASPAASPTGNTTLGSMLNGGLNAGPKVEASQPVLNESPVAAASLPSTGPERAPSTDNDVPSARSTDTSFGTPVASSIANEVARTDNSRPAIDSSSSSPASGALDIAVQSQPRETTIDRASVTQERGDSSEVRSASRLASRLAGRLAIEPQDDKDTPESPKNVVGGQSAPVSSEAAQVLAQVRKAGSGSHERSSTTDAVAMSFKPIPAGIETLAGAKVHALSSVTRISVVNGSAALNIADAKSMTLSAGKEITTVSLDGRSFVKSEPTLNVLSNGNSESISGKVRSIAHSIQGALTGTRIDAVQQSGSKVQLVTGQPGVAGIKGLGTEVSNLSVKADQTILQVKVDGIVKEVPHVAGNRGVKFDITNLTGKLDLSGNSVKAHGLGQQHGVGHSLGNGHTSGLGHGIRFDGQNGSGARIDIGGTGIRFDGSHGTVRGDGRGAVRVDASLNQQIELAGAKGALSPQLAASIINAIKLGQPLPDCLSYEAGQLTLRNGEEVLFFPGLRAALKFAEVIGLRDSEAAGEEADASSTDGQDVSGSKYRVRYMVRSGETVESIAQDQLGDKRYADLIVTINRSEIIFKLVDDVRIPFVYEGQSIWLPSEQELSIFAKHFLRATTRKVVASVVEDTADESSEVNKGARQKFQDEAVNAQFALPSQLSRRTKLGIKNRRSIETPLGRTLRNLRYAGMRRPVQFSDLLGRTEDLSDRHVHRVGLGQTLASIAACNPRLGDVRYWRLLAQINDLSTRVDASGRPIAVLERGQELLLPTEEEIRAFCLISSIPDPLVLVAPQPESREIGSSAPSFERNAGDTVIVRQESAKTERLLEMRNLSSDCRLIVSELDDAGSRTRFSIRLEYNEGSDWNVVASYDCYMGRSARTRYGSNGQRSRMVLSLPEDTVKQMAMQDFVRNFRFHIDAYKTNKTATRDRSSGVRLRPVI